MSKVSLAGNASGTGIFTIASPNSNTDRTLTLPDNTGTILTSATNLAGQTGVGKVLQVVQTSYSTNVTTSSSSNVDTGLNASITPSSSSSRILIMCAPTFRASSPSSTADAFVYGILWRGAVGSGTNLLNYYAMIGCRTSDFRSVPNMTFLDSPATTSSVTYRISMNSQNASSVEINATTAPSIMILMEIAA
jgi:hypothetical protein